MSNPERVNIFVDGEFYCGIDGFHLYGLGLRKGAELSEQQIRALEEIREQEAVNSKAMSLLSYRDRSTFELKKRLLAEGFGAEAVKKCIGTLVKMGAVNDAAFVRRYAESARGRYPRGKILAKLWEWGVPYSFSRPIVEEVCSPEEETEMALALARKKAASVKAASRYERRAALYRYLTGKGFDGDTASAAVEEALG